MPKRCVVFGCSNGSNVYDGIALHTIPFANDERPEAKKRRKAWVNFVKNKRMNWTASSGSVICSKHFEPEDFFRRFSGLNDEEKPILPRLKTDDVGVCVCPSILSANKETKTSPSAGDRRRMVFNAIYGETSSATTAASVEKTDVGTSSESLTLELEETNIESEYSEPTESEYLPSYDETMEVTIPPVAGVYVKDAWTQTSLTKCHNCTKLSSNLIATKKRMLYYKSCLEHDGATLPIPGENDDGGSDFSDDDDDRDDSNNLGDGNHFGDDANNYSDDGNLLLQFSSDIEEEPQFEENSPSENESDEESNHSGKRVFTGDENLRTQPKFVVFLSQLLILFNVCSNCKMPHPLVEVKQFGTMAYVTTTCHNERCKKPQNIWKSQPTMPGTMIPAGNFLLSFAILVAGGSASKVIKIFETMGLACISLSTFFRHQRTRLFPTIYLHWQNYQKSIITELETLDEVVVAGDGRHDSMGHSAKYGAYTMFCCNRPIIMDFTLVQRNEAGNSPAMEYLAFKRCLDNINSSGINMKTFVSDRHTSIRKHMREQLPTVTHYFDLWHLKKKVHKVLTKISKEKDCESLKPWIKSCINHLYWSATSTNDGNGEVIWAKFESFFAHIVNLHTDLPNPIFNKCAHDEEITDRTWFKKDTTVHDKLCIALNNKRIKNGISQASPLSQTSCLEGFHSVLNHFAPKMIAYSFQGMYCRHILAAVHFNYNLYREVKKTSTGENQVKVVYPKFKNGEATVREIRVEPNFDYVDEIYKVFIASDDKALEDANKILAEMTPAPMDTMLEKQPKGEAIAKMKERAGLVNVDVPATAQVPEVELIPVQASTRAKPRCRECGNPMKGHKDVIDCIRNQQL